MQLRETQSKVLTNFFYFHVRSCCSSQLLMLPPFLYIVQHKLLQAGHSPEKSYNFLQPGATWQCAGMIVKHHGFLHGFYFVYQDMIKFISSFNKDFIFLEPYILPIIFRCIPMIIFLSINHSIFQLFGEYNCMDLEII